MTDLNDIANSPLFPSWLRRLLSTVMALSAAVLYAVILGIAVVRTATGANPTFPTTMSRAASVLSGLIGSVVTAGFARAGRVSAKIWAGEGIEATAVGMGRLRRNLLGLADTIGLPLSSLVVLRSSPTRVEQPATNKLSFWVALLYFLVYFAVGIGSFIFSLVWRGPVPELITNAGWVWLGAIVSSAYSFFGLQDGGSPGV